jgi:hypothetical protein
MHVIVPLPRQFPHVFFAGFFVAAIGAQFKHRCDLSHGALDIFLANASRWTRERFWATLGGCPAGMRLPAGVPVRNERPRRSLMKSAAGYGRSSRTSEERTARGRSSAKRWTSPSTRCWGCRRGRTSGRSISPTEQPRSRACSWRTFSMGSRSTPTIARTAVSRCREGVDLPEVGQAAHLARDATGEIAGRRCRHDA